MKKYIFLNLPAHGHINPTLAVAKELVDRGNKVIYYATDEFKEKIKRTGAEYRAYNIDTSDVDIQKLADLTAMIEMLLLKTEALVPQLIEEIKKEKPDCIIHDSVCVWGKVIGNQLQIPTICSVTTFAMNGEIAKSLGGSSLLFTVTMQTALFFL
jgi:MGT family glycosyltransferase